MKVVIVGGGPSGLFLSILLKRQLGGVDIEIHEQNPESATFGFGVVIAENGLSTLHSAAPEVCDDLMARMHTSDRQTIVTRETPIEVKRNRAGQGGGAIPRITLLKILQKHARQLGVQLVFNHRIEDVNALSADLIVGADGVNSQLRTANEAAFGTTRYELTNHFAWYGVEKPFPNPALVFRKHREGYFVAHYYPYSDSMSTFVAECDHQTWQDLGMELMQDEERQRLFEGVFAPELAGYPLISNNSTWRQFPVIRNRRWYTGNKVLIGDALNSAHFSIGSGTRIAMEDSIALAQAVAPSPDDIPAALKAYEEERGPQKLKLIKASEASFNWYERIREWMDAYSPPEFVYQFMIRTGRIDLSRLRRGFPELADMFDKAGVLANEERVR